MYCGADRLRPYSQAERVVGSSSPSCNGRPRRARWFSIDIAVPLATTFISGSTISRVPSAGRASTTLWPSDSSSRPVASTAARTSACTGSPSRVVAMTATRRGPRPAPLASTADIGSVQAGAL